MRELLREGEGGVAVAEAEAEAERGGGGRGERGGVAGVVACAAGVVGQRGDGRAGMGRPPDCAIWSVIRV